MRADLLEAQASVDWAFGKLAPFNERLGAWLKVNVVIEVRDVPPLATHNPIGRAPRPPATLTSAIALQRRRWPARWRQSKRRLEQFVPEGVGAVPLAFEVRPLTSHYCLKLDDLRLQCLDLRRKNGSARRARGWGPH
jgi:hypothetical protein